MHSHVISHDVVLQIAISVPILCFHNHGVNLAEAKFRVQRKSCSTSLEVRWQFLFDGPIDAPFYQRRSDTLSLCFPVNTEKSQYYRKC